MALLVLSRKRKEGEMRRQGIDNQESKKNFQKNEIFSEKARIKRYVEGMKEGTNSLQQ
jgi:hypothetical protein